MRYSLRTLLVLMAVGPPMLAGVWLFTDSVSGSPAFWLAVGFMLYLSLAFGLGGTIARVANKLDTLATGPGNRN